MTQKKAIHFLTSLIIEANDNIKFYQELIDEWNDPKNIAVRACEMLKKTHQRYVKAAQLTIIMLEKKSSKH